MQCPICERTWPDEFKVCPLCAVPLSAAVEEGASGAAAQGPGAQAAGERGVAARDIGGPVVTGDHSAAAGGRGAAAVGDGNIVLTGNTQGGVSIVQGGLQGGRPAGGPSPAAAGTGGYDLAVVRTLLLAAFTGPELNRLFLYAHHPGLRPVIQEFSEADGPAARVDKGIAYCLAHGSLPDLLREVERANPRQYARYAARLRAKE